MSNQIGKGKNGYIAFYKSKKVEVYADTTYEAQQLAAQHFKARKSYDVTVMLAEKNGQPVTHSTTTLASSSIRQIEAAISLLSSRTAATAATTDDAESIADAIQKNVKDFYANKIDYDRFSAQNRALWDSAMDQKLDSEVKAELLRREKAGKRARSLPRTAANLAKTMALGLKIGHSIQVFDDDGELFDWDELTKVILRVLKREKNSADILGVGTKDFKKMVVKMLTMWAKQSAKGLGYTISRDDMDYILDFAEEFANDNESGW
jgi:hypothetical protein